MAELVLPFICLVTSTACTRRTDFLLNNLKYDIDRRLTVRSRIVARTPCFVRRPALQGVRCCCGGSNTPSMAGTTRRPRQSSCSMRGASGLTPPRPWISRSCCGVVGYVRALLLGAAMDVKRGLAPGVKAVADGPARATRATMAAVLVHRMVLVAIVCVFLLPSVSLSCLTALSKVALVAGCRRPGFTFCLSLCVYNYGRSSSSIFLATGLFEILRNKW